MIKMIILDQNWPKKHRFFGQKADASRPKSLKNFLAKKLTYVSQKVAKGHFLEVNYPPKKYTPTLG